jgi:hypothetical protein
MLKYFKNQFFIITLLIAIVAFGSLSFRQAPQPGPHKEGFKNLKILPKDIDHASLIAIMHNFEHALNFRCEDCHAKSATDPKHLDFASDSNPHKEVARHMMKMMKKINRKYFKVKGDFAANYLSAKYEVTCYSCHHGDEHPLKFPKMEGKEKGMQHTPGHGNGDHGGNSGM